MSKKRQVASDNPIALLWGIIVGLLQIIWYLLRMPFANDRAYKEVLLERLVAAERENKELKEELKVTDDITEVQDDVLASTLARMNVRMMSGEEWTWVYWSLVRELPAETKQKIEAYLIRDLELWHRHHNHITMSPTPHITFPDFNAAEPIYPSKDSQNVETEKA